MTQQYRQVKDVYGAVRVKISCRVIGIVFTKHDGEVKDVYYVVSIKVAYFGAAAASGYYVGANGALGKESGVKAAEWVMQGRPVIGSGINAGVTGAACSSVSYYYLAGSCSQDCYPVVSTAGDGRGRAKGGAVPATHGS
jgi:hypothetical protein